MRGRISNRAGLILLGVAAAVTLHAETWTTITTGWRPNRITVAGDLIWASSTGGLYRIDPVAEEVDFWNKDQSLFSNVLNVVEANPVGGELWVGYADAAVDRIDPATGEVIQRILDFNQATEIFEVYDITFDGEEAYVATDIGVSRMVPLEDEDLYVVQETYRRFGGWEQPIKILNVAMYRDTLYAGGELGLAFAGKEENLFEANSWNTLAIEDHFFDGEDPDLPYINEILPVGDDLYICSYEVGAFVKEGSTYEPLDTRRRTVYTVVSGPNGTLYGGLFAGLFTYSPDDNQWQEVSEFDQKVFDLVLSESTGNLWAALDTDIKYSGRIGRYNESDGWLIYPSNTPGGNEVSALNCSPDGSIWASALGVAGRTVNRYKDGMWTVWSKLNVDAPFFGYTHISIEFDGWGGTWIASRGNGLLYIEGDSTWTYLNADSSEYISRLEEDNPFTLIADFARDPGGGFWITNPGGLDELPLLYLPPAWFQGIEAPWLRFGNFGGILQNDVAEIEVDSLGRIWLAATQVREDIALLRMDPGESIEDRSDDTYLHYIPSEIGLAADGLIRSLLLASDGVLWIGTSEGLYYL
ncbi:hypothetical protein GF324_00370, partial [bacterium]|nr:hypothetical protein [bacterium]